MVHSGSCHTRDPRKMFLCRTLLFFVVTLLCAGLAAPVQAQERYDDSKPREKFQIRVGGYYQRDIKTTLRIDSTSVNLGSFLELEDNLDVDSELSVLRVDGFYRFNPRHRIDWTWYVSNREGLTTLEEDIEIGDQIFPAGATVESELKSSLLKIGYSWSFINVRKYEFYLGGGLNFNDFSFRFVGQTGTEIFVEDEGVVFPLPTVNFGGRYNFTEKTQLSARWELFDLAYGDYEGRLQEVTLTLEHNTFNHIGFGGALSSFVTQLEIDDDDWRGELERSHNGVQLFMRFYY